MEVAIRKYAEQDYQACQELWAELTEHHRAIYGDRAIGGDDPGSGFDDYLATPERVKSWVAAVDGNVTGLTGLLDHGTSAEVEPVVVTTSRRAHGIGRLLIETAVSEATRRGYEYFSIRPVARNVTAIQAFHRAGFQTLGGHVDLTMDLRERRHAWLDGLEVHGLNFRY